MQNLDIIQRFVFDNLPVRGVLVHLHHSYKTALDRHPYPPAIQKLLGETLTASTLLSAILKFTGSLTLQVHGTGAVKLLVAQADHKAHIRGLVNWEGDITDLSFAQAMENGTLALTIKPSDSNESYQGIVELKGESLSEALENYFLRSEQLPTFIHLTANDDMAAGMLLQVLPDALADSKNAWEHVTHLSRTLTDEELLKLSDVEILTRLFHQEQVRLFESDPVIFYCDCNRERMERAILTMGKADALELANEKKVVRVTCEFCNRHHDFDLIDVHKLFL